MDSIREIDVSFMHFINRFYVSNSTILRSAFFSNTKTNDYINKRLKLLRENELVSTRRFDGSNLHYLTQKGRLYLKHMGLLSCTSPQISDEIILHSKNVSKVAAHFIAQNDSSLNIYSESEYRSLRPNRLFFPDLVLLKDRVNYHIEVELHVKKTSLIVSKIDHYYHSFKEKQKTYLLYVTNSKLVNNKLEAIFREHNEYRKTTKVFYNEDFDNNLFSNIREFIYG
jgi:hypothetical protein